MFSSNCFSGYKQLTHHSRVNCAGINESISWDAAKQWYLKVNSLHYIKTSEYAVPEVKCDISSSESGWPELTHRAAAIHWFESVSKDFFKVLGEHHFYVHTEKGMERVIVQTLAVDVEGKGGCNISDGWW